MADIISKTVNTQIRKLLSDGTYQVEHPETKIENVLGKATKEEAEAGVDNAKYMTPLRVKEFFVAKGIKVAKGSFSGDKERDVIVGFRPTIVILVSAKDSKGSGFSTILIDDNNAMYHVHNLTSSEVRTVYGSRGSRYGITSTGFKLNDSYGLSGGAYMSVYWVAIG